MPLQLVPRARSECSADAARSVAGCAGKDQDLHDVPYAPDREGQLDPPVGTHTPPPARGERAGAGCSPLPGESAQDVDAEERATVRLLDSRTRPPVSTRLCRRWAGAARGSPLGDRGMSGFRHLLPGVVITAYLPHGERARALARAVF